jgi:hypothetical protein
MEMLLEPGGGSFGGGGATGKQSSLALPGEGRGRTGDVGGRENISPWETPTVPQLSPMIEPKTKGPGPRGPEMMPLGGVEQASLDRGLMNRALASESSVDASANLDVSVRGPAGVETKVSGDGMFKGNTSLNRQVELT